MFSNNALKAVLADQFSVYTLRTPAPCKPQGVYVCRIVNIHTTDSLRLLVTPPRRASSQRPCCYLGRRLYLPGGTRVLVPSPAYPSTISARACSRSIR